MTVYALRLTNGTDTAARVRMGDLLGLAPSGNLGTRSGIRPGPTAANVAVVAGAMQVTVQPFVAWVDGGVSDTQGGYPFVCDAAVTLTLANGHATLPRTDVIVARVRDDAADGSGFTDATVEVVAGTAGSGAPALPTNCVPIRNVVVPAGASVGTGGLTSGALSTDRRTWLAGLGGVIPVATQAERDALPAVNGLVVYRIDTDTLEHRRAGTWEAVGGGQGHLGTVVRTIVTGINTEVELTTLGVTTAPSRRVKLTLASTITPTIAGSGVLYRIKRGGTTVGTAYHVGAAAFKDSHTFVIMDPTAPTGAVTYSLTGEAYGATPQTMEEATLVAEDIGRA